MRVIAFPHAGGNAGFFRGWAGRLPPEIEVLSVQYPGRMDRQREPPVESMDTMSEAVTGVLVRDVRPPFALFGHSMGAAIAYECARRLEDRHGLSPERLFVSGRRSPSRRRAHQLSLRTPDEVWSYARRLGGTEQVLIEHPEARAIFLPPLLADCRLLDAWTPRLDPPLRCPVTALVGDSDPETSLEEAAAWSEVTRTGCDTHVFEGGHFYLVPHAAAVSATIVRALDVPAV